MNGSITEIYLKNFGSFCLLDLSHTEGKKTCDHPSLPFSLAFMIPLAPKELVEIITTKLLKRNFPKVTQQFKKKILLNTSSFLNPDSCSIIGFELVQYFNNERNKKYAGVLSYAKYMQMKCKCKSNVIILFCVWLTLAQPSNYHPTHRLLEHGQRWIVEALLKCINNENPQSPSFNRFINLTSFNWLSKEFENGTKKETNKASVK